MDIGSLKPQETINLQLYHPAHGGKPLVDEDGVLMCLILASPDSPEVFAGRLQITDDLVAALEKEGRTGSRLKAAEMDAQNLEATIAATRGWTGKWDMGGEPFTYSPENARKLYVGIRWVREQAEKALGNRRTFFTFSKKDSSTMPEGTSNSPASSAAKPSRPRSGKPKHS